MLLYLEERILMLDFIRPLSKDIDLEIIRDLYRDLYINQDDVTKKNMTNEGGMIRWDQSLDDGKEIEFAPEVIIRMREILKGFESEENLHRDHFKLYELFCGGE